MIKRMPFLTLLFAYLLFIVQPVLAQNRVSVTQKGSGNSASISQTKLGDKNNSCQNDYSFDTANIIIIDQEGALLIKTERDSLDISDQFLNLLDIQVHQKNLRNSVFIHLQHPDSAALRGTYNLVQKGRDNSIEIECINTQSTPR
jgi:hypothetical protein